MNETRIGKRMPTPVTKLGPTQLDEGLVWDPWDRVLYIDGRVVSREDLRRLIERTGDVEASRPAGT